MSYEARGDVYCAPIVATDGPDEIRAKIPAAELSWGAGPYTPHPWRVRYYPERLDKTLTAYVVERGNSGGFLVLDNNPGRARADAYLIGAAPALAEALRALVNAYDGQGSTVAALAAARAALQYAGATQ